MHAAELHSGKLALSPSARYWLHALRMVRSVVVAEACETPVVPRVHASGEAAFGAGVV